MEKKLNLLGARKLKLVEAEQTSINEKWLQQQLQQNDFELVKDKNKNIYKIYYYKIILRLFFTYDNKEGTVFNQVMIENTNKFPLIKQTTETLTGLDLTTDNLKNKINLMIPSSKTIKEDLEELPTQSIQNIQQWEKVKKYLEKTFKLEETGTKDDTGIEYNLTNYKKPVANISVETLEWGISNKKFKFNDIKSLFNSVAKNLGIKDLTSQILDNNSLNNQEDTDNEEEVEDVEHNNFNRNSALDDEYKKLRAQLSDEVKQVLSSINEDYDNKNINIWELAYNKCKTNKEKDILIKAFMNRKMNISAEQIDRNTLGLRQWVNERGFDIHKNLALRFIEQYNKRHPGEEIPSGSLIVLGDITNKKLISEENINLLTDQNSILYQPDIYKNIQQNYKNLIDILIMYEDIYNSFPISKPDRINSLLNQFKFLTEEDIRSPQMLAAKVCMDGDKLRDKTTIETAYSILTGKNYTRAVDDYDDTIGVEDIIKDIDYDKKIDNLYKANQKTLKLVSNGLNKTFKENPKALGDFKKNLSDMINPQQ